MHLSSRLLKVLSRLMQRDAVSIDLASGRVYLKLFSKPFIKAFLQVLHAVQQAPDADKLASWSHQQYGTAAL